MSYSCQVYRNTKNSEFQNYLLLNFNRLEIQTDVSFPQFGCVGGVPIPQVFAQPFHFKAENPNSTIGYYNIGIN